MCYINIGDNMRTFYIFKINKEMAILTKDSPYNIYKNMEQLKKYDKKELAFCYNIYDQLIIPINNRVFNNKIFKKNKDNLYYEKNSNIHSIYNKYKPEDSKLIIKNSYILLKTDSINPTFLEDLSFDKDLFVCDFDNRDYFWIEKIGI